MKREELVRKVSLYLERAENDSLVENHPLEMEGYWRVMGGAMGDYGHRTPEKNIVQGKFIDAVAYAVQQPKFYADLCSDDDPRNCNHGKVEKIKAHELKDKGLAKAVKKYSKEKALS